MIEISHKHAQRLLREELDRRLANDQWPVLQAHLENCSTCREYQKRLSDTEKNLRRVVRVGLASAAGPERSVTRDVINSQTRLRRRRKQVFSSAAVFSIVALFFVLGGPGWIMGLLHPSAPLPVTGADIEPTPAETVVPTAEAGIFPGIVVYAAWRDGRSNADREIYLVNVGTDPVDITNNPADDTDPAWSPDGEWIAFLSNRKSSVAPNGGAAQNAKPKSELYVTNITGNRVVQLTANPGIVWQGPISWSPDGKMIALAGTRATEDGKRWIYVVALDGSGARLLQESMGGWAPKFSPAGDKLAFSFSDHNTSGVRVLQLNNGSLVTVNWLGESKPDTEEDLMFDWSIDGAAIAYVAGDITGSGQPDQSQIIAAGAASRSLDLLPDLNGGLLIAASKLKGAFGGLTWTPGNRLVLLQDTDSSLLNEDGQVSQTGCWTIRVNAQNLRNFVNSSLGSSVADPFKEVTNMCVIGGIDRGSWSPDFRWLVVLGRYPNQNQSAIYAIRMPEQPFGVRRATPTPNPNQIMPMPGDALRLADEPHFLSIPRVRPGRRFNSRNGPLYINPQPVRQEKVVPAPLNSGSLTGDSPW